MMEREIHLKERYLLWRFLAVRTERDAQGFERSETSVASLLAQWCVCNFLEMMKMLLGCWVLEEKACVR